MFGRKEKTPDIMQTVLAPENMKQIASALAGTLTVFGDEARVHIAKGAGVVNSLFNTASGHIYIGAYTFTGHNVSFITGTHDISKKNLDRMTGIPEEGRDIIIGQGVWIASNSVVLGPCTIEDDAVVAAGSVVLPSTHIGKKELYAGVPAVYKKTLTLED